MELDIFYVREKVLDKFLLVCHVPAYAQLADVLTKPLAKQSFLDLRSKLRVLYFTAFQSTLCLRGE